MADILGVMVALIISLTSVTGFMKWASMGTSTIVSSGVAGQGTIYMRAVERYVQDNAAAIAAVATPTTPFTITTATLVATNYLPGGFTGGNMWGQTWQAQVLQPAAGQLQAAVMTTGGQPITDAKQLVQIAAQMGAQGGFVPPANMLGNAAYVPSKAFGSFGGWSLPIAGFTNPGAGHIFALLAFSSTQSSNGYLYRVAVPGQPQLNAMQTELSMTDTGGTAHNINGIAAANALAVNASGLITAGTYSGGAGKFQVDVTGRIGSGNHAPGDVPSGWSGGVATADVYAHGSVGAGTGGTVAASMANDGTMVAASGGFRVNASGVVNIASQGSSGAACTITTGAAALTTDVAGVPLTCVGGRWTPIGGKLQKAGFFNAVDGTIIPTPSCPATATPSIIVTMTNIYIDPTASASYLSSGAGPWVVLIRNGSNTPIPGGAAQVETFCAFS